MRRSLNVGKGQINIHCLPGSAEQFAQGGREDLSCIREQPENIDSQLAHFGAEKFLSDKNSPVTSVYFLVNVT